MSNTGGGGGGGGALPTGCYKCGRPGHWSRDCPSSASSNPNPNPSSNLTSTPEFQKSSNSNNPSNSSTFSKSSTFQPKAASEKPKKVPKTRPKLTPELLLSDEGIGYILRYFPRNFKNRGRGHEVSDLRNLLRMYADWHSQLLPYFPFDQFIHKVEEIASSRRVRTRIAELKDRIANGEDPTKLKESPAENDSMQQKEDLFSSGEPTHHKEPTSHEEDFVFNDNGSEDMQEDILNEIYKKTVEEASNPNTVGGSDKPPSEETLKISDPISDNKGCTSNAAQISEEQKALMQAKRLKALERAAARSRLLSAS